MIHYARIVAQIRNKQRSRDKGGKNEITTTNAVCFCIHVEYRIYACGQHSCPIQWCREMFQTFHIDNNICLPATVSEFQFQFYLVHICFAVIAFSWYSGSSSSIIQCTSQLLRSFICSHATVFCALPSLFFSNLFRTISIRMQLCLNFIYARV